MSSERDHESNIISTMMWTNSQTWETSNGFGLIKSHISCSISFISSLHIITQNSPKETFENNNTFSHAKLEVSLTLWAILTVTLLLLLSHNSFPLISTGEQRRARQIVTQHHQDTLKPTTGLSLRLGLSLSSTFPTNIKVDSPRLGQLCSDWSGCRVSDDD